MGHGQYRIHQRPCRGRATVHVHGELPAGLMFRLYRCWQERLVGHHISATGRRAGRGSHPGAQSTPERRACKWEASLRALVVARGISVLGSAL